MKENTRLRVSNVPGSQTSEREYGRIPRRINPGDIADVVFRFIKRPEIDGGRRRAIKRA